MTINENKLSIFTICAAILTCTLGAYILHDRHQSNETTITIFADTCTKTETGLNCDGSISR